MKQLLLTLTAALITLASVAQTLPKDTTVRGTQPRLAAPNGVDIYSVPPAGQGPVSLLFQTASKSVAEIRSMNSITRQQAPQVITTPGTYAGGSWYLDVTDRSSPDNTGTVLVTSNGLRYKRQGVDVMDPGWFGAVPNDTIDDAPAIQAAERQAFMVGGVDNYRRLPVKLRPGVYIIGTTLNFTNGNGMILMGTKGRYQNTFLQGRTGNKPIVDFTGATLSGLVDINLGSFNADANASTIGVTFALSGDSNNNQLGGLNSMMRNVSIILADIIGANGGMGSVGLINVRSEEFTMEEVFIRANLSTVFTNTASLQPATGYAFTATSDYANLLQGTGSMGVVNIRGVSFQNYEKTNPAMLLNGTNSVDFQGFISRAFVTPGRPQDTYETAIRCTQTTIGLRVNGTVESFSQLLSVQNDFQNGEFNVAIANQSNPSTPVVQLDSAYGRIRGSVFRIAIPNVSERDGRYLFFTKAKTDGNEPVAASIVDTDIICHDIFNNAYLCSPHLLKNCDDVTFRGALSVSVDGGVVKQLVSRPVISGGVGSLSAVTVSTFTVADRTVRSSQNAGSYTVRLTGTVTAGGYGAGCRAVARYVVTASYVQKADGAANNSWVTTVTLVDKTSYAPSCLSIDGLTATIDESNPNVKKIKLLPTVTGFGNGEPVKLDFRTEVQSDFYVNRSMLIGN
ncbi:hypothetical protein CLV58_12579 [Spirosoma oryzae]|uniref:Pectate lyase-like protein n=1 Tax=Spirosoma oryzae TaxID=1469603 RepID=A0A2T0S8Q6_9BACT|nr:hypothetical protein [Spirosoma oryzae]PRY29817.1 hypothetical protein CLV58_12579 [Spirosoma oryzae]